jgi:hypothetical protein
LLLAQPQEMLSDNDQKLQKCGEVIAKSKQSGASPERSSYSIVHSVSAQSRLRPIQLLEGGKLAGEVFPVWSEKLICGGVPFLLGIFRFFGCFAMVNRGEFVVKCVANVVC